MVTNDIKPRFEERIVETLDIKKMQGLYLLDNVCRKWKESFTDTSTGEIIEIERTERLFDKGTLVRDENSAKIQFAIEAGDITEPIRLTDTKREGRHWISGSVVPMMVQIYGVQKAWVLLWARSLQMAEEICSDYCEQVVKGTFATIGVKRLGATLLIRDEDYERQKEQSEKCDIALNPMVYYKIEAMWKEDGSPYPFVRPSKEALENIEKETFVCMADSVEDAQEITEKYIRDWTSENKEWGDIEIAYKRATPLSVNIVVPWDFCKKYFEREIV